MREDICDATFLLFVSSTSGIVLNPRAGANIDPSFKTQLCVADPCHRNPVCILPHGLSKPGDRVHGRIHFCHGGIQTYNLLIDRRACYR